MLCLNDSWASRVTETQCKQTCSCNTCQSRGRKADRQTDGQLYCWQRHRETTTQFGIWSRACDTTCFNIYRYLIKLFNQPQLTETTAVSRRPHRQRSSVISCLKGSLTLTANILHSASASDHSKHLYTAVVDSPSTEASPPLTCMYVEITLTNHYCSQWARVSVSHCCTDTWLCVDVALTLAGEGAMLQRSLKLLTKIHWPWRVSFCWVWFKALETYDVSVVCNNSQGTKTLHS